MYVSERGGESTSLTKNMKRHNQEGNKGRSAVRRAVGCVVIAGVVASCTADARHEPAPPRSIVTDVIVTIDNRTSHSASIYIASGAWSDSLGAVPGRSSRSFSVPSRAGDATSALRLRARAGRTSGTLQSSEFFLTSGHQVIWTLDETRNGTVTMR